VSGLRGEAQSSLSSLTLAWCSDLRRLNNLHRLPLRRLWVISCPRLESLAGIADSRTLQSLRLKDINHLWEIDFLSYVFSLRHLALENCTVEDWSALLTMGSLKELTLVNNNSLPDLEILTGMRGLKKVRIEGLGHRLGPEAETFAAELQSAGVHVIADTRDDSWLLDEEEEELADREDLDALAGREELADIRMSLRHLRTED